MDLANYFFKSLGQFSTTLRGTSEIFDVHRIYHKAAAITGDIILVDPRLP